MFAYPSLIFIKLDLPCKPRHRSTFGKGLTGSFIKSANFPKIDLSPVV